MNRIEANAAVSKIREALGAKKVGCFKFLGVDWLQNNMDWKDFAFYLQEMPRSREHNPEKE